MDPGQSVLLVKESVEHNVFVEYTPEYVGTGTEEFTLMEELGSGEAGLGVYRIPWFVAGMYGLVVVSSRSCDGHSGGSSIACASP